MGKLAIISDLHVDINHLQSDDLAVLLQILQDNGATHLHLAGDIANKVAGALAVVEFFQRGGLPTTFNWGNHEMPNLVEEAWIEQFPHLDFLNLKTFALRDDLVLLGVNGWYDYRFATIDDFDEIVKLKNLYWYDRNIIRSGTDPEINQGILNQLRTLLMQLQEAKKEVVIATHFVPQRAFIVYQTNPEFIKWNELNAFLGAESFGELMDEFTNVRQVVFGHTHRRFPDQVINGTIYSCRPFGYYFEWQMTREFVMQNHLVEEFNPMRLRGILRAHQGQFDGYKKQHLAEEFQRGITWIDY